MVVRTNVLRGPSAGAGPWRGGEKPRVVHAAVRVGWKPASTYPGGTLGAFGSPRVTSRPQGRRRPHQVPVSGGSPRGAGSATSTRRSAALGLAPLTSGPRSLPPQRPGGLTSGQLAGYPWSAPPPGWSCVCHPHGPSASQGTHPPGWGRGLRLGLGHRGRLAGGPVAPPGTLHTPASRGPVSAGPRVPPAPAGLRVPTGALVSVS